ncbi:MAG: hypothetical protein JWQ97_982 [Phenylobacterium sp.]|nr:hypothetical protein [Phenylobacterium sp.]
MPPTESLVTRKERNRLACQRYRARKAAPKDPFVDLPGERWLPYPGSPDRYEVSNLGRVRTRERVSRVRIGRFDEPEKRVDRVVQAKLRRQYADRADYLCVAVAGTGKPSPTHHVHTMVCETFHGPRPEGRLALHRNDVRHDNRDENLRWGTPAENVADAWRNGCFGRPHPSDTDPKWAPRSGRRRTRSAA